MIKIELKVKRAVETNKLKLEMLGERNWYNYFIRVSKLIWERNNYEGYLVEVYTKKYGDHLASITI